ncbi:MerC domain-containing protein [Candidatus Macondimonas diazotrophica]|jgi:hypothetical protein|uniref:MerC domain-containing protein n=1 Tax=Candidatus Macondimonas diazotrophica TaxID=2305248 RepID=UPI00196AA07A|nr:MerC domain-containing protein [Candidatus Macondimonas diazotrophica]
MQRPLDLLAISISGLCAVHCLLMPLVLIISPVLSGSLFAGEDFHQLLLWVILPTSGFALWLGCRRHKDRPVLLFGVAGLSLLLLAAFLGHRWFGEWGERLLTVLGGAIMASGHVRNYRLCRRDHCAAQTPSMLANPCFHSALPQVPPRPVSEIRHDRTEADSRTAVGHQRSSGARG